MTEDDYRRYVSAFNARDYATLESFFADDFALETAGFMVRGKPAFRRFYAFLHDYVREIVSVKHFFPGERAAAANVLIRFEGLKDLSPHVLAEAGYPQMTPVPRGEAAEVEFIIVYEMRADGLVDRIKGAVFIPGSAS